MERLTTKIPLFALAVVACLSGGAAMPASALPPASTPPVSIVSTQTIYAGSLQNNWENWSWAQTAAGTPAPALSSGSLAVRAQGWQAVYLHHSALRTTLHTTLNFWINGGPSGGQTLVVRALRSGVPQTIVPLGRLRANTWQQVQIPLPKLGVSTASDLDGFWIQNYTPNTAAPFYVDRMTLSLIGGPVLALPPAAPDGLTATPKWNPDCPTCGMPMAHIILAWNTSAGATSYTVYRNGVKLVSQAAPSVSGAAAGYTDMGVTSGQSYSYTVSATGAGGEGPQSAAVSAVAPSPPASPAMLPAPTNLGVVGTWAGAVNGSYSSVANRLGWTPVPGAASYNVYQSDVLVAQNLTKTAFTITPDVIQGNALYTVTAVNSKGMESLPSAVAGYTPGYTPANIESFNNYVPTMPDTLAAAADWNLGAPRVTIKWHGYGVNTYNIYRDGVKIAGTIWRPYYVDAAVLPGSSHSYTVSAENTDWLPNLEGPQSAPITATTPSAAPAALPVKVQITKVVAGDDSAVVFFAPVAGAVDYRIYDATRPSLVKYAGEITQQVTAAGLVTRTPIAIQWNGINPVTGADLVVQAVDKFGPFQKMDGAAGDGTMSMSGMNMNSMSDSMPEAINGQGDPSNSPNVLAQSDSFHVTCKSAALTGAQAFFDTFRGEAPLVKQSIPAIVDGAQFYGDAENYEVFTNNKWEIREYGTDLVNSQIFFMGNHFMDTIYDGGGIGSSCPPHNNNASLVMMPKATADISGGKVLHVTFEVDAHMDGRRWCELMIGAPGDPLIDAAKFDESNRKPTVSGKLLRWQILSERNGLNVFLGDGNMEGVDLIQPADWNDLQTATRILWDHAGPLANGTTQDLDKRHRFDLYLSKTHYRIQETSPDGLYNVVREKDFPAGVSLPFDQCQVYFVHQLYHTANDLQEQIQYQPYNSYWTNFRPYSDERHWDNMGFEVLPAFPALATP